MLNTVTVILEFETEGPTVLRSLEDLRHRFEVHGPLAGLGEVLSVRVSLGTYRELLAAQTRAARQSQDEQLQAA